MRILRARSTPSKSNRPHRPFGEGILPPEPPDDGHAPAAPAAPADPWDVECDPTDWPDDTDADRWTLTDTDDLPPARTRRMPYTAVDALWARAYGLSLDAGWPLPPPSDLTALADVAAWESGAAAAAELADARGRDRLAALALEAAWQDHCELAEARVAPPGEWRD